MHGCHVKVLTILFLTPIISTKYSNELIERESLQIIRGHDGDCVDDCSLFSLRRNKYMQCSIVECRDTESLETAQAPDIEEIFIHVYTDKKDRKKKLALHVGWSPPDNVSLQKTTGYKIQISNGNRSYTICYNITTPMEYPRNSKDIYYNNCFGKAMGTHISPGTDISISITSLPLWSPNHSYGTTKKIVQVPDCTNGKLYSLVECEKSGKLPTTKPCISDSCNTKSHMDGQAHHVNCTVSKHNFGFDSVLEQCDSVSRVSKGMPSAPVHVANEQEWYKYIDEKTGQIKLALNFSWMPGRDSSIQSLREYYVEILQLATQTTIYFNKCFAIHTPLEFEKHREVRFYYDCYGRHQEITLGPGTKYHIHIQSRPYIFGDTKSDIQFVIKIPTCKDKRLQDVTACQKKDVDGVRAEVKAIYCNNNSIQFSYNISSTEAGQRADILLCGKTTGHWNCDVHFGPSMVNIEPSGTIYNISFPSDFDKTTNISIGLQRSINGEALRHHVFFSFSKCIKPSLSLTNSATWNSAAIPIISVITVLCLIGLLILYCYFSRRCAVTKDLLARYRRKPEREIRVNVLNDSPRTESSNHRVQDDPPTMPSNLKVFVVFMDDHKLHKDVIHWFCAYLKQDLGLDVRVHIWQPADVALNQVTYMKDNMRLADKVVIICSEGTKRCMEKTEYDGDLFTPIVREVSQDAFLGKNPGKFLVGYFPYSKPDDVPELLHDQCLIYFALFKLMKQFEQFYFRLVGIEKFQQGAIYRIDKIAFDRYFDPGLTTCGMKLKESIDRMVEFVDRNPTWYNDYQGSELPIATILAAPCLHITMPQNAGNTSILEDLPGHASICHITAKPPPCVSDGHIYATLGDQSKNLKQQSPVITNSTTEVPARRIDKHAKMTRNRFTHSETDNEIHSSLSQPSNSIPDEEDYAHPAGRPYSADYSESNQPFFRAESFNDQDFIIADYDSFECSPLDSNMTQVTILGLSASQEMLAKSMENGNNNALRKMAVSGPQLSPESGIFNLALIEDGVEDFEDEFKTINLTKHQ